MTPSQRQRILDGIAALGQLPTDDEGALDTTRFSQWETLLAQLSKPVSNDEALLLATLFPSDESDAYGLAWTLLHLIETAPGWPIREAITSAPPHWRTILDARL